MNVLWICLLSAIHSVAAVSAFDVFLVAGWDFQDAPHNGTASFVSTRGANRYVLFNNGTVPVQSVAGGAPTAPSLATSLLFSPGSRLAAAHDTVPALTSALVGRANLTLLAWVQRHRIGNMSSSEGEFIAGVWNEYAAARQYALFINVGACNQSQGADAHVSDVGGPTPGHEFCVTAACGRTPVPYDEWHCIAMQYDGVSAKSFFDGSLDATLAFPNGLFAGNKSDFAVGANHITATGPVQLGNLFTGLLGRLDVYNAALSPADIATACQTAS